MSRLSIRLKLLIVFMAVFTVAFAAACYAFYVQATAWAMDDLRRGLTTAASTAASLIDAGEHAQVFDSGAEDDALYTQIAEQLRLVSDANPRIAAIYTMVRSPNPDELLFVVSADEDPETRAGLREAYDVSEMPEMIQGFDGPAADAEMGADKFGVWLSGYAPIRDETGRGVAIVGVDMTADDVLRVQAQIRDTSIAAFLLAYAAVFAAVFLVARAITQPLNAITGAADALERGEPFEPERLAPVARSHDELGQLARMFSKMAVQLQARERKLKQEVAELRIEIDQAKAARQVAEITETDYFQALQQRAREMRDKREAPPDAAPG
jgi:HAMP domain-containing protein